MLRVRSPPQSSIYLADLGHGAFKIGFTRCLRHRLRQLGVASLQKIALKAEWKVPRELARAIETVLKRDFVETFRPSEGGTEVFYGSLAAAHRRANRLVESAL